MSVGDWLGRNGKPNFEGKEVIQQLLGFGSQSVVELVTVGEFSLDRTNVWYGDEGDRDPWLIFQSPLWPLRVIHGGLALGATYLATAGTTLDMVHRYTVLRIHHYEPDGIVEQEWTLEWYQKGMRLAHARKNSEGKYKSGIQDDDDNSTNVFYEKANSKRIKREGIVPCTAKDLGEFLQEEHWDTNTYHMEGRNCQHFTRKVMGKICDR